MTQGSQSGEAVATKIGQILLLEEELRQEQLSIEAQGGPPGLAVLATPVPEEKLARLEHFQAEARQVLTADGYRELRASPARLGLLWREYLDSLHALRAALKARKRELAEQRFTGGQS